MWRKLKRERGFTLVELLVVIAIIGILAAIIAPNAFKSVEKGKVAAAEADYKAIKAAALNFYTDTGKWAPSYTSTIPDSYLVTKPSSGYDGWNGPYLERWPSKNPWGDDYQYINDPDGGNFGTTSGERFLTIKSIPKTAAQRIDADLDGTEDGTKGIVRYDFGTNPTDDVTILISADGQVQ